MRDPVEESPVREPAEGSPVRDPVEESPVREPLGASRVVPAGGSPAGRVIAEPMASEPIPMESGSLHDRGSFLECRSTSTSRSKTVT